MTPMRLVSLNLPVDLIVALGRAARQSGQTPQDLLRDTLRRALAEQDVPVVDEAAPKAGSAPQADGDAAPASQGAGRIAQPASQDNAFPPPAFSAHLAFAEALGWLDLQSRLRAAGFVLRLGEDGVLALHTWPADHRLIDSAALGQPLADLTLRFRAPFPGQMLAARAAPVTRAARRFPAPPRYGNNAA